MKKALLATLVGASVSLGAWADSFEFSYAESIDNFIGFNGIKTYDVAVFLPGETFQGCKIKSVSGPINATAGVSYYDSCSVWLSTKLLEENGVNAPNIVSVSVDPVSGGSTSGGYKYGLIQADLPEEYTITDAGVYVGYSFNTKKVNNTTKYPVAVGLGNEAGSFFAFPHAEESGWMDYSGQGYALPINIELEGEVPVSASVSSAPECVIMKVGEAKTIQFNVAYNSLDTPVTSLDFEVTIGGKSFISHYDLDEAAPAGLIKSLPAVVEIPAQNEAFIKDSSIKVVKVNGESLSSVAVASDLVIRVFENADDIPVRRSLMEEYTSTSCPWCTRGFAALEYLAHNYPEFITASYHVDYQVSDPMQVTTSLPYSSGSLPGASLNRDLQCDPYYGTEMYDMPVPIVGDIQERNNMSTPWDITVSYDWEDDNNLVANVEAVNVIGKENSKYMIGYLLIADGLSGTTPYWIQYNNYSSKKPEYVPELNNFCKGGKYGKSKVSGLVFNDVVISVDGYMGVKGSVPSSIKADEVIEHCQTWDISTIESNLVPDKTKLRIVAFVVGPRGEILNAAKVDVKDEYSGVRNVEDIDSDAPVEYYNLSGVKVAEPSNGIFIRRQGSKTEKVVVK